MSAVDSPSRPRRPTLRSSSFHGGSYLNEFEQYKPSAAPYNVSSSIDSVLETRATKELPIRSKAQSLVHSIAPTISEQTSSSSGVLVRDSGIVHSMTHRNCQPLPDDPVKLVATLFYNSSCPVHPHAHPDQSPHPTARLPRASIAEGAAPTEDISKYPLEPPVPEPEPLDHLYGPYVSQLCLTHFLHVLSSLPLPQGTQLESSHRCLSPSPSAPRVMEVTFSPPPNSTLLTFSELTKHELIYRFEREWNVEVILQPATVFRRHKRLAVFDMDSTLIQQEVIDEIARFVGVSDAVSAITSRAMNGELDFSASLRERVALLKGVPANVFESLKPLITLTPGAVELCALLKRLGFTLAVLSGGFQPLADWLAALLNLDHAYANHLVIDDETHTLTGELSPDHPIINGEQKQRLLTELAAEHQIPLAQTLAVGDGANDIPMLKTAGLGLAWKAKAKVQMEAPARLNVAESLLDVAYLLGLTKAEIDEILALDA